MIFNRIILHSYKSVMIADIYRRLFSYDCVFSNALSADTLNILRYTESQVTNYFSDIVLSIAHVQLSSLNNNR